MKKILFLLLSVQGLAADDCYDTSLFDYGITPPISCPSESGKFSFAGEYLLLKPHVHRLKVGTTYIQGPFKEGETGFSEIKEKHFNYNFDSGFRLHLGYGLPYDAWSGDLSWTWIKTSANSNDNSSGFYPEEEHKLGEFFAPGIDNFIEPDDLYNANSTNSSWKMRFNQIDATLFREFIVGSYLSLKPIIGVQLLFIEQRLDVITVNNLDNTLFYEGKWKSLSKGVGVSIGIDSFYDLGCNLGIYGFGRYSLLITEYNGYHYFNYSGFLKIPYNDLTLKSHFETAMGIEWRTPINCMMHLLFFRLGFESQMLVDQNSFPVFNAKNVPTINCPVSTFSLFGLKLAFGVKF